MKRYTSESQTAKLIELGVEKPKGWEYPTISNRYIMAVHIDKDPEFNYSIGELIEMLPRCIESRCSDEAALEISYDSQDFEWYCGHRWVYNSGWRRFNGNYKTCDDKELIDALYRYIVALKEEGVI